MGPLAAVRALQGELKKIHQDPIEGVVINLVDESNLFEWDVGLFGAPATLYEGGYFKVCEENIEGSFDAFPFVLITWPKYVFDSTELWIVGDMPAETF